MAQQWLSIVEYARAFNISDMTIRRRIKTGKLQATLKDGKYFIPVDVESIPSQPPEPLKRYANYKSTAGKLTDQSNQLIEGKNTTKDYAFDNSHAAIDRTYKNLPVNKNSQSLNQLTNQSSNQISNNNSNNSNLNINQNQNQAQNHDQNTVFLNSPKQTFTNRTTSSTNYNAFNTNSYLKKDLHKNHPTSSKEALSASWAYNKNLLSKSTSNNQSFQIGSASKTPDQLTSFNPASTFQGQKPNHPQTHSQQPNPNNTAADASLSSASSTNNLSLQQLTTICQAFISQIKNDQTHFQNSYENKILCLEKTIELKDLKIAELKQKVEDLQTLIEIIENQSKNQ